MKLEDFRRILAAGEHRALEIHALESAYILRAMVEQTDVIIEEQGE